MLKDILDAADMLRNEGIHARVINVHTIKPLDRQTILRAAKETGKIVVIEDHNIIGGLGSAAAEVIAESGIGVAFLRLGLQEFSKGYGTYTQVKAQNGIGIKNIMEAVKELVNRE